MNSVSVAFQSLLSCLFSIGGLRGAAKDAFAALPSMCDVFVADVALGIVKTNDGVRPIGVFGAVHPRRARRDVSSVMAMPKS